MVFAKLHVPPPRHHARARPCGITDVASDQWAWFACPHDSRPAGSDGAGQRGYGRPPRNCAHPCCRLSPRLTRTRALATCCRGTRPLLLALCVGAQRKQRKTWLAAITSARMQRIVARVTFLIDACTRLVTLFYWQRSKVYFHRRFISSTLVRICTLKEHA